jgi:gliding motility-associated-like protein
MKVYLTFLLTGYAMMQAIAQYPFPDDLYSWYSFEGCPQTQNITDQLGNTVGVFKGGLSPDCVCGVRDTALRLDGGNDYIEFEGNLENIFSTRDFTVSFYLQPAPRVGLQEVIGKRNNCDDVYFFSVTYNSNTAEVTAILQENASKRAEVKAKIDPQACWTHVTIVRDDEKVWLYIDGEEVDESVTNSRVDVTNGDRLMISPRSKKPCQGLVPFAGYIDELLLYRRALEPSEIDQIYLATERIRNVDTTIFIGSSVPIEVNLSCTNIFSWTPTTGVADPSDPETVLSPEVTTTYALRFTESGICTSTDSIRIRVIDPSQLDCDELFLPSAFTPNGDGLNETFGISNPYVIQELISFEILDRWGSQVFLTTDPNDRWDGSFRGQPMNPGIVYYRLRYRCGGEEKIDVGNVTIIR